MIPENIENIIVKFLSSQATAPEIEQLEAWLQNSDNEKVFRDYVKVNYFIEVNTMHFDKAKLLEELSFKMHNERKTFLRIRAKKIFRYAALVVLLISSYWAYDNFFKQDQQAFNGTIKEAILKSEDGTIKVLNPIGSAQIKDSKGSVLGNKTGNTLEYKVNKHKKRLVYNTLTVPYGRQFTVKLSDGTCIELNSGTSLRFPVEFLEGKERKVFIEYGEAYFDVAEDPDHPFIVNNNKLDIKVLGTQFNVSAYPENIAVSTVLVEGSVQLTKHSDDNKTNSVMLEPGYQATWSDEKRIFEINKADLEMHTAWRTGRIILKSLPFSQMAKKLERHYDVIINCNEEQLNREIITATFDEESIEDVLKLINELHPINYEIDGRDIVITKNNNP